MEIFLSILYLAIGLVLLIFGGDWFVKSAISIAKKTKIPEVIIGATIVSIATTLPELLVTIISSSQGIFGLAVGNAIGSCIVNAGLIAGIGLIFALQKHDTKYSSLKMMILISLGLLLLCMSLDYKIGWIEGAVLIVFAIIFMVINVIDAKDSLKKEKRENINQEENAEEKPMPVWKIVLLFVLGAGGIGGGAELLVMGGENLARLAGLSETFIGLTIVGIGTSLPELVTTISSIRKKAANIGVGNIIGANVLNMGLLVGLSGVISGGIGLDLDFQTLAISIPVSIIMSLVLSLPLIIKKRSYKWQGYLLVSLYVLYFVYLIVSVIFG